MSGKRPKGSLHACRESMATADSHATTKNGQGLERFTPCPELYEEGSDLGDYAYMLYFLISGSLSVFILFLIIDYFLFLSISQCA